MKTKEKFIKPAILREVSLESEERLLVGSIVDEMTITSLGQDVTEYDFSDESEGFNFDWEED